MKEQTQVNRPFLFCEVQGMKEQTQVNRPFLSLATAAGHPADTR